MSFHKNILSLIKKAFELLVNVAPFIMLFTTLLSGLFSDSYIYEKIYPFLPDAIGYSILCDLVMVKLYFRRNYCFPTKVAVCALIFMNLTGFIYAHFGYSTYQIYSTIFDIFITAMCFIVTASYYFIRWKK